jgi:hypothetical protein
LINGAPGTLDTLNEIANALGSDANLSVTLTSLISNVQSNVTSSNTAMTGYVDAVTTAWEATAGTQLTSINNITNGTATFGNLIPSANVTYDLGSETARWKDLWLSGDTINLGGSTISQAGGAIVFSALPGVDLGLRNVTGWQDYANDVNIAIGDSYTIDSTMGTWGDFSNPGPGPYLDGAVPGIRYAFGVEPAVPAQWSFTYDINGFVDTITLVSAGDPIQYDDQFEFIWYPNASSTITPVYVGEASTDPIVTTNTLWNADGKELYINKDASNRIVSVTGTGWTGADFNPGEQSGFTDGRIAILKLPDDSVVFNGEDGPMIGAVEDCFALSYFIVRTETSYAPIATTSNIPAVSNVAISGNYNDLINTPNLAAISDITNGTATFGNINPSANVTYSLGSETAQWKDLWISGNTINIGGTALSVNGNSLSINGNQITTQKSAPANAEGTIGDTIGDTAFTSSHVYYCKQTYAGIVTYSGIASQNTGAANGRIVNTFATGAQLGNVRVGWTITGPNITGYATITQINYSNVNEWEFVTNQTSADLRNQTGYTFSGYPGIWVRSSMSTW